VVFFVFLVFITGSILRKSMARPQLPSHSIYLSPFKLQLIPSASEALARQLALPPVVRAS
ncbi:MAG: hypothetical protein L3J39_19360, partial [Verrucomicrobiales bacterium]|nr:hypothetical protein [Verrucomicrobiales bacterium]